MWQVKPRLLAGGLASIIRDSPLRLAAKLILQQDHRTSRPCEIFVTICQGLPRGCFITICQADNDITLT
jgi:hypothetical protein